MHEPPARAIAHIGRLVENTVDEAIEDHEQRMHIPPPRRGKVTAIPFPNLRLDDSQVCRAWEMLTQGASIDEAAAALDMPTLVVVRCLSEYQPAWRNFLAEREAGA